MVLEFGLLRDAEPGILARLDAELMAKYGVPWTPEQATADNEQIITVFERDACVLTARADGAVRGFCVVLADGDHWYVRHAGFDYEYLRPRNLPLYFELLYYRLLDEAAARGVRRIHYGLGSSPAKTLQGCATTAQFAAVLSSPALARRTAGG